MRIRTLSLRNFRNIHQVTLSLSKHINVFVGDNGQGKTNLLEAIVFLSYGRSFRVNDDKYLIENDQAFAEIKAELENGTSKKMRAVISNDGKYLNLNDVSISRLSDFIGVCNVVLFHPDDLQFYTQTPKKRRREIDYELGKQSQLYTSQLSQTMRLIQERNSALKAQTLDKDYLKVVNQQIAQYSVELIKKRFELVETLNPKIQRYYDELVETTDSVSFSYVSFIKTKEENNVDIILKRMEDSERRDREFKMTHIGIHRDDFVFMVKDMPVINRLSQGQRRALIVAYKLALIEQIYENTGSYPIFCMDDLLSELDETRRAKILNLLPADLQCIITTTDVQFLDGTQKKMHIYDVSNGIIEGGR